MYVYIISTYIMYVYIYGPVDKTIKLRIINFFLVLIIPNWNRKVKNIKSSKNESTEGAKPFK